MSGINNVILDSNLNSHVDYYRISGHYHVSGRTKSQDNQGFSADLEIDHTIGSTIGTHGYDSVSLYELINKLNTAIVKIKSFRSKQCADTLSFAPDALIEIEHITNTSFGPIVSRVYSYPITKLSDLEKLISDITPHPVLIAMQTSLPLVTSPDLRSGSFTNSLTENESTVKIKGNYSITGTNDESLAYNSGFKTTLSMSQCLNLTLTRDSSTTKDHLKDILSTALNKAKAFRNPDCQDVLQFAGAIRVKYQGKPEFIYQITDLYSFSMFVDFVSHLKLSAQNNTTVLCSSPESNNQSLNPSKIQTVISFKYDQGKLRREQSSVEQDSTIDNCWQRLKKCIYG